MATTNHHSESRTAINNPGTSNATYLQAGDVRGTDYWSSDFLYLKKQTHYRYLNNLNSGRKLGPTRTNNTLTTYEAARDLIDIITGQLDMTPRQRRWARREFINLDRERLGLRLETVAYCLAAYVVEQDERNERRRSHPNVPEERRDKRFRQIEDSLGLTSREIQKCYGKLQFRLG